MMKTVNVGILGFGTVGAGAVKLLLDNAEDIKQRVGAELRIKGIADLDTVTDRKIGYDVSGLLTGDALSLINDPDIHIIVETIGGVKPAESFVRAALGAGKSVVTANKMLIAKEGAGLMALAREKGADLLFEASVGGGIPSIDPIKNNLAANRINKIIGIVNGTTNYLLSEMKKGKNYSAALKEAQSLGYAEQDPTSDVEGFDSMYKLAILSRLCFNTEVCADDIYREGITSITDYDIKYANEMGYQIRLLAMAERTGGQIYAAVHPALVPDEHPIAGVDGVMNAVFLSSDGAGDTMYYGAGAGSLPAGSAIAGDVAEAARNILRGCRGAGAVACYNDIPVAPAESLVRRNYIRIIVRDEAGCIAAISGAFARYAVSLESIIQKNTKDGLAEVVWLTHAAEEERMRKALSEIEKIPLVDSIPSRIRVI
ncbi:MAG: homoserine dehydrogenase [Abditibacteriota bacterium]|nr:homoserine dehydrogenase [Abditibacteriota bacterium]